MLAKLEALMYSYVKNSEVTMFFRVFTGNELREFFEEKWEILNKKKTVDMQGFNLKCLLRGREEKWKNKTKYK